MTPTRISIHSLCVRSEHFNFSTPRVPPRFPHRRVSASYLNSTGKSRGVSGCKRLRESSKGIRCRAKNTLAYMDQYELVIKGDDVRRTWPGPGHRPADATENLGQRKLPMLARSRSFYSTSCIRGATAIGKASRGGTRPSDRRSESVRARAGAGGVRGGGGID